LVTAPGPTLAFIQYRDIHYLHDKCSRAYPAEIVENLCMFSKVTYGPRQMKYSPFDALLGGRWATRSARANAPGNEVLLRTTNEPGLAFARILTAEKHQSITYISTNTLNNTACQSLLIF